MARKSKDNAKKLIGKSYGCEIDFQIQNKDEKIKIFTTRPDTIFGATFYCFIYRPPLSKAFSKDKNFLKFKEECDKTGTTEEALANAKIRF